ncbi:SAM-dependent methyltransferase [Nocardioides zeae]|uniref:SAM-dependent methyltransferase n=1 Tax=Nocardioides zeae TaxID=1457234 RepID=A0ACC6IE20_9ACTN|nr:class I SAM-dependent methyltransferase [Nocardioides zeae]MDR6174169.1 SAM-dependent methyltransferase [Nocardioides zeae]MDR6208976.1 SAM-dependent methyltransferase [Nocardioides zeae]
MTPDPTRARVFGSFAEDYDRYRPDYPAEALDWVLGEGVDAENGEEPRRVADVGAGTGKLTAALAARRLDVVAIDPDEAMLAQLAERVPSVERHVGRAEELPLEDDSVDMVLLGQAWHWVELEPAVAEVRRVLRPGGSLALLWNTVEDDQGGWVAEIESLDPAPPRTADWSPDDVGLPEGESELAAIRWTWWVNVDQVVSNLATHSGIATLPDDEREALLDRARGIVERAVEEQDRGDGMIAWPHTCLCVRWTPRD